MSHQIIDRLMKPLFRYLFKKSIKDKTKYPSCWMYTGETMYICKELMITNQFTPFVFLVDRSGFVTFRAVGVPEEEEISLLKEHLSTTPTSLTKPLSSSSSPQREEEEQEEKPLSPQNEKQ